MSPDKACTSLNVDSILLMMMNTKTITKPMVVISDNTPVTVNVPVEPPSPRHPGKYYIKIKEKKNSNTNPQKSILWKMYLKSCAFIWDEASSHFSLVEEAVLFIFWGLDILKNMAYMKHHGRMCVSKVVYVSVTHRSQALSCFVVHYSHLESLNMWLFWVCVYLHVSVNCAFSVVWEYMWFIRDVVQGTQKDQLYKSG